MSIHPLRSSRTCRAAMCLIDCPAMVASQGPSGQLLGDKNMAVVETERRGQVLMVRMNRPERLNALNHEMRTRLAETWTEFRHDDGLEVAIFTGTGRGFCAGEDMKESFQRGLPGGQRPASRGRL